MLRIVTCPEALNAPPVLHPVRATMNKLATIAAVCGLTLSSRAIDRIRFIGTGGMILFTVFVPGSTLRSLSQRLLRQGSRWRAIAGGASYTLAGVFVSIPITLIAHVNSRFDELIRSYILAFSWSTITGIGVGGVVCLIAYRFRSSYFDRLASYQRLLASIP